MGPTTSTFYKLYARAERHETIVLTNLMFETIGSTTYRLALRTAKPRPAVRQMLTILTRDESFHVPLNVHFLRRILEHEGPDALKRLRPLYHVLTAALMASAAASRRRAKPFDHIPFKTLARAYAEQLGRLFVHADDFGLKPSRPLLATVGLRRSDLLGEDDVLSAQAAERNADRSQVVVSALCERSVRRRASLSRWPSRWPSPRATRTLPRTAACEASAPSRRARRRSRASSARSGARATR